MRVKDGKGVKHDGIKVEFVGSIGESRPVKAARQNARLRLRSCAAPESRSRSH